MLYGGLFLIAGAALLAITIGLVAKGGPAGGRAGFVSRAVPAGKLSPPLLPAQASGSVRSFLNPPGVVYQQKTGTGTIVELQDYAGRVNETFRRLSAAQAKQLRTIQAKANADIAQVKGSQLSTLVTESGIALGIMALASIALGWLMAGRALRPMRTMSSRARGISERNLHERLALEGPDDELKELAQTFDGLLGRLEGAFESQRRFVANASHELRTPITLERTLVEVALADPRATIDSLRDTCRRVLAASEQQERLIEALLTLARSQRGVASRAPFDLSDVTAEVVQAVPSNGLRMDAQLDAACTTGDPAMVERLVVNLIENAVRYNRPGGWLTAWTGLRDGLPTLEVTNAGPVVDSAQVDELCKPFVRAAANGSGAPANGHGGNGHREAERGLGLGLSIVQAISEAHGARLTMAAQPEGGLRVAVAFPAASCGG
jgi:signal transduction histidine kinase